MMEAKASSGCLWSTIPGRVRYPTDSQSNAQTSLMAQLLKTLGRAIYLLNFRN